MPPRLCQVRGHARRLRRADGPGLPPNPPTPGVDVPAYLQRTQTWKTEKRCVHAPDKVYDTYSKNVKHNDFYANLGAWAPYRPQSFAAPSPPLTCPAPQTG
jgi:hypothetical protein